MLISENIRNLIYEIADISAAISDAITPSGLGKAASVAKKVAGAAQESDTAKHTKKILDSMGAARNATGPKTAGNMSPEEFNKMLDSRKSISSTAKAVHKVATNIDHPKSHMLAAKWATDEKGLVKGTKLTPEQYTAYREKHGGTPNPAAHVKSSPPPLKISDQPAAKVGAGEVAAATAKPTWQPGSPEVKEAQKAAGNADQVRANYLKQVADKKMEIMHKAAIDKNNPPDTSAYGRYIKPTVDVAKSAYNSKYNRPISAINSLFNR